jgi:putative toxin-antitoxin system antitoxin component (TIGR02293 family)
MNSLFVHPAWLDAAGQWIGKEPESEFDLARYAEAGLPTDVIRIMTGHGLTSTEVDSLVIPHRTLKHRRSRREPLSREESDRAIRLARILARAAVVFGSEEKALRWMRRPAARFENRSPMQMLSTEAGGRLVEEALIQIDEGMFA